LAAILGRLVEAGATIVVVLHELGPLAPLITRIVVLDAGSVVRDGVPEPADLGGIADEDPHPARQPAPGLRLLS
jgi:zinc transport system ATP-binding protein